MRHDRLFDELPLVAILRGVTPERVVDIGQVLVTAGIRVIEVPLNSPEPFKSIGKLHHAFGTSCLVGAGSVLRPDDVDRVRDAGGELIVAPNVNPQVIARACGLEMVAMPGFATATEAFTAIDAGAMCLKLFPAVTYGPSHLNALRAVLGRNVRIYAVGGIGADNLESWARMGASGFGFGSEIFKLEYSLDEVANRARRLVEATKRAMVER
jgi:2-dehydro-3-deoxyphosphogalactonate aldolase